MKKIISLLMILSLFCCVGVFAQDSVKDDSQENSQNKVQDKVNDEKINKEAMEKAEKYAEQMVTFFETFMNNFKDFVSQDDKQDIVNKEDKKLIGITLFSKKKEGDVITKEQLRVFQVLKPNIALVKSGVFPNEMLMLLIGEENDLYYDNQKINLSEGYFAKQVGIYQYNTKGGNLKTIPAVKIKK